MSGEMEMSIDIYEGGTLKITSYNAGSVRGTRVQFTMDGFEDENGVYCVSRTFSMEEIADIRKALDDWLEGKI